MSSIINRLPPIVVEYDRRGKRVRKFFCECIRSSSFLCRQAEGRKESFGSQGSKGERIMTNVRTPQGVCKFAEGCLRNDLH